MLCCCCVAVVLMLCHCCVDVVLLTCPAHNVVSRSALWFHNHTQRTQTDRDICSGYMAYHEHGHFAFKEM